MPVVEDDDVAFIAQFLGEGCRHRFGPVNLRQAQVDPEQAAMLKPHDLMLWPNPALQCPHVRARQIPRAPDERVYWESREFSTVTADEHPE